MNALLWILQGLLALLYIGGGAYKLTSFDAMAAQMQALPLGAWRALGAIEMIGGVLLIFPAAMKLRPGLTPIAAALLAIETLGLAVVYARYSLALTAANPLPWAVVMALLAGVVAWGRWPLVSGGTAPRAGTAAR